MSLSTPRIIRAPLPHLLSLPDDSATESTRAVLCFLHGYDEAAPADIREGVTRHGPLRDGVPSIVRERFIVVAPQLPTAGDHWVRYADAVKAIVDSAVKEHRGDRSRLYLTGFSFGGNGVLDLALRQPGYWAALWAVDPTRVPESDPGPPVWISIGEAARRRTNGFVRALRLRDATAGDDAGDRVFTDHGASHVGTAYRAYGDVRIYSWLLSHARVSHFDV